MKSNVVRLSPYEKRKLAKGKPVTFWATVEQSRRIKAQAALEGKTISEFILEKTIGMRQSHVA
jgi:uncharacterized protein (DUF1778 family)